jgi:hypothetical protein
LIDVNTTGDPTVPATPNDPCTSNRALWAAFTTAPAVTVIDTPGLIVNPRKPLRLDHPEITA